MIMTTRESCGPSHLTVNMLTRATHRSPPIFDCSTSKFEITTPFLVLFNKILQKEAPVCSKVRYLLSKCNAKTKTAARRTGRLRQIGEGLVLLWFFPLRFSSHYASVCLCFSSTVKRHKNFFKMAVNVPRVLYILHII